MMKVQTRLRLSRPEISQERLLEIWLPIRPRRIWIRTRDSSTIQCVHQLRCQRYREWLQQCSFNNSNHKFLLNRRILKCCSNNRMPRFRARGYLEADRRTQVQV
jgi:hypothetical protein